MARTVQGLHLGASLFPIKSNIVRVLEMTSVGSLYLGIRSEGWTTARNALRHCNGNTQPWSGGFTRDNGSTGQSGVAEVTGSLLLASNGFYRKFTDNPVVTPEAGALPQMGGSGWVRDLREAMSLGTPQALALKDKVAVRSDMRQAVSFNSLAKRTSCLRLRAPRVAYNRSNSASSSSTAQKYHSGACSTRARCVSLKTEPLLGIVK